MANIENNVAVKHFNGKLSKHFVCKLIDFGKVGDATKITR